MKPRLLFIYLILGFLICNIFSDSHAKTFKIASYNVENLFDLKKDPTDYQEFIPNSKFGWNHAMLDIKLKHISKILVDINADIVALEEVESKNVLTLLKKRLSEFDVNYPYFAIADDENSPIKCALLSKFPILRKSDIRVGKIPARHILKVTVNINGNPLIVYANHWKSKTGPESQRIAYASALAEDIGHLKSNTDFILIGDFNSDYNEYETFKDNPRLNDTGGITGINHILNTIKNNRMVDETAMLKKGSEHCLYNLWLEVPVKRRWSVNFFGKKNSPDAIIISKGLFDGKGISYKDNSFDRFDPDYLFRGGAIYRWQRAQHGKGRHLGFGYSDHLPVVAEFTDRPFQFEPSKK